jgi:excisionase family DNA binding protein
MTGNGKIDSPLLTASETCKYLRITENTLYRWIKSGKIPVIQFGKQYRIRVQDLDNVTRGNKIIRGTANED